MRELMPEPDSHRATSARPDDEFHELLMSTLPNKYMRSAYDRITGLNTRFRIMTGKVEHDQPGSRPATSICRKFWRPALAGDWDSAADALQRHLEAGSATRRRA
ncbi:MAG: FCD domain-containing protein [Faecalibacterium prausnitzii]